MPKILVIAELEQGQLKPATLAAVGFARQVCGAGGSFEILVAGKGVGAVADLSTTVGDVSVGRLEIAVALDADGAQVRDFLEQVHQIVGLRHVGQGAHAQFNDTLARGRCRATCNSW